jgi:hypothetical protein
LKTTWKYSYPEKTEKMKPPPFFMFQKPPTEIATQKNTPQDPAFTNQGTN